MTACQPVPIAQHQHAALRESFLYRGGHGGPLCRRCPYPDPAGELLGPLPGEGVQNVEDLLQRDSAVDGVRRVGLRGERHRDRDRLRRREVDRRQRGGLVQHVAPAWAGLRPHRQPGLLQGGDVPLDRAGAHLQPTSQPRGSAAVLAGAAQLLT